MRTLQDSYALLGHLLLDERVYLVPSLSFDSLCLSMDARPRELDALLEAELGMDGESLLGLLREREPERLAGKYSLKRFF